MDISHIHGSIILSIDEVGSYSTDQLVPEEIDDYINKAVRDYINEQRHILRTDRPEAEEVYNKLYTLETSEIIEFKDNNEDLYFLNVSSIPNFDYYISSKVFFGVGGNKESKYGVLKHKSYFDKYSSTKYNTSLFRHTPVYINDEFLHVLQGVDDQEPTSIDVTYLETPTEVSLEDDITVPLPAHTHRDIVDLASQYIINSLVRQQQSETS